MKLLAFIFEQSSCTWTLYFFLKNYYIFVEWQFGVRRNVGYKCSALPKNFIQLFADVFFLKNGLGKKNFSIRGDGINFIYSAD